MWILVIFIYVQTGLNVEITSAHVPKIDNSQVEFTEEECNKLAAKEWIVLEAPRGADMSWQAARCVKAL